MEGNRFSNNQSDLIQVQPYQKKYISGLPGSSPMPISRKEDDLNYQQKYGKGPLIERAERLKRLQELKDHMSQRADERGVSDDGVIRMIRDDRMRRNGGAEEMSLRAPSSNLDIIHRHNE